jgi:polysaccharide biosynthesis transport protein
MEQLPVHQRRPQDAQQTALEPSAARQVSPAVPYGGYVEVNAPDATTDEMSQWLEYLNVLRRHKVALVAITLCGALVAFVVSLYQTPIYIAGTTLEMSQQQPSEGIPFLNTSDPYLLQTQAELLKSRTLQDRVYAKLSAKAQQGSVLAPNPLGPIRDWLGLTSPKGSLVWHEAIRRARAGLTVTPVRESRIVRVASESTLPQVAADYVNTLAEEFIQQNLEERWSLYQTTGAWLARAQEELKTKLEESEQQLLAYASASGLVITSKEENIAEQSLIQLQAEVSRAQADRIAKESVYRTAMAQPAETLAEVLDAGPMGQYQVKLTDLRRELADVSTSLTAAHPKVKSLQAQIAELESSQSREHSNILNRIRTDYESALHRERQLLVGFASQSKVLSDQDQKLIRYKMLQREADTYRKLYETTLQRGKEASVASALRPINARLVDSARPPGLPYKPNLTMNLIFGLVGGLVTGVALVLLRERTDTRIRTPGSMSPFFNLRELGVIPCAKADLELSIATSRKPPMSLPTAVFPFSQRTPNVPRGQTVEPLELMTWNRKTSLLAESFRSTLTSILMSGENGHDRQVILVTSPSPREGKSTVVTNLALALGEIHQRVLLIDADLRRPRLHTIFGQANTWGLSDLLREKAPFAESPAEALARRTHIPGVFLIPSGPASVTVSRLLHSARMAELINRVRNDFDSVLIDTPPVLSVADARILSRLVDAVVLVFRAGQTRRETATMAVNVFEADGIPVLGTILNDWDPRRMGHGSYPSNYLQQYRDASSY